MNISTHSCCNLQELARRLKVAALLLHLFVLHIDTVHAYTIHTWNDYHLSSTINFRSITQCPSQSRSTLRNRANLSSKKLPFRYWYHIYNSYNSIFSRHEQLRPLTFRQQLALLDVFDALGITEHHFSPITMINLTQKQNLSALTPLQLKQVTEWREVEGAISQERACLNNSECKEKVSQALFEMGMYDSQVPDYQQYDYTLFLGGSIQQMQWRMMMLLSLFDESLKNNLLDLGEIVALTCNRVALKDEVDGTSGLMFDTSYDTVNEIGSAPVGNDGMEFLITETTGYQAIIHSLRRMNESPDYFARFRQSSIGYHTTKPVSFLGVNSFEDKLYRRRGFTFQLSDKLRTVLKKFFERYPDPLFFETQLQKEGETLKKRPTTKKTVKKWLAQRNNQLSCKDPDYCKILVISNAPNMYYQHTAVLQALEESITKPTNLIYEVITAGPGASMEIPTNALLDNLTKLIYLEVYHPED